MSEDKNKVEYDMPSVSPFGYFNPKSSYWHGSFMSDEDLLTELEEKEIEEVIWSYDSGQGWDGDCAAIVKMKDGRYVTWESWWGPTGDGFNEDAYGGDSDIHLTKNLKKALLFGLSGKYRDWASKALGIEVKED